MNGSKAALGIGAALLVGMAVGRGQPPSESEAGFYRASEVLGTVVRSEDGQELGKVTDLLIERETQIVRYFVLGEGESNLRAIPWAVVVDPQIGPGVQERFVTVRIDRQRWDQAPAFTWQQIQAGGGQAGAWVTEVDRFYGVEGGGQAGQRNRDGRAGQGGEAGRRNRDAQNRDAQAQDRARREQQDRQNPDRAGQGRGGQSQGDRSRQGQQNRDPAADPNADDPAKNAPDAGNRDEAGQNQAGEDAPPNEGGQDQPQQDAGRPEGEAGPQGGGDPQGGT